MRRWFVRDPDTVLFSMASHDLLCECGTRFEGEVCPACKTAWKVTKATIVAAPVTHPDSCAAHDEGPCTCGVDAKIPIPPLLFSTTEDPHLKPVKREGSIGTGLPIWNKLLLSMTAEDWMNHDGRVPVAWATRRPFGLVGG